MARGDEETFVIFVVEIDGAGAEGWLHACGAKHDTPFPRGVFAATNPVRATGTYYFPDDLSQHATLVSAEGLRRTDPAYLERAILPFADWRRATRPSEWLDSLYTTLVDASLRGYPLWLADSEACHEQPQTQRASFAAWMGRKAAEFHVDLPPRSARSAASDVLDEFKERLARRAPLDADFVDRLPATHQVLVEERTLNEK